MTDKKKNSIILLFVFCLLFVGMGILWLILKAPDSSAPPATSQPGAPSLTSAPLKTELVILRDQVHSAIHEHGTSLLENNFLTVNAMVELKQNLQQADDYYQQGKSSAARPLYRDLLDTVEHLVTQQQSQSQAEQLAAQLIDNIKAALPTKNAAPTPYQLAVQASDQGRTLIQQKNYSGAVTALQEGLDKIQEHQDTASDIAQHLINAITAALEQYDIPQANAQLTQLEAIHSKHPAIDRLRTTIQTVESLQSQLVAIEDMLANQQFEQAIASYDQLIAQHPTLGFIQQKRTTALQNYIEHKVRPLITTAETLYQEGKLNKSLASFKAAQRILPEDLTIAEAIQHIENEIRAQVIEQKLAAAYTAYDLGQWQDARKHYEAVLALDPNNAEAREGKDKATQWLIKTIEYQQLIANAEKDYQAGRMPSAITRLNQALAIKPANLALTAAQSAMRQDLKNQNKKISVTLKSDKKSYVSIIGALPPEQFKSKALQLYPNVYRVKAQRSGYHEVEREIKINANNPSPIINIRCIESL